MATAPKWTQDLVVNALVYWQKAHGEDVASPEINWRRSHSHKMTGWNNGYFIAKSTRKPTKSSGQADLNGRRITVTAGSNRLDQRLVTLHELGHVIAGPHEWHSAHFWDIVWELYRWARIPVRYAKTREGNYRKGALVAYKRSH